MAAKKPVEETTDEAAAAVVEETTDAEPVVDGPTPEQTAAEAEKVEEAVEPDIVKSEGVPPTIVNCGGQDHIKAWELGNGGVLAALEGHGMCFIPGATIQNSPAGPQIVV